MVVSLYDLFLPKLLERRDREVVAVKYQGVWLVVDNGYHNWSSTVPPFLNTCSRREIWWSEWTESMGKDGECTFGILKGRWRILKTGVRLFTTESVDKVWLTCCALHNMLIDVDGLDKPWDGVNIPNSVWDDGEFSELKVEEVPMALRRMLSPDMIRNYDNSSVGADEGNDCVCEDDEGDNNASGRGNDVRKVRDMSLKFFRSKLVEHFDIMYEQRNVVWPKRRGPLPIVL